MSENPQYLPWLIVQLFLKHQYICTADKTEVTVLGKSVQNETVCVGIRFLPRATLGSQIVNQKERLNYGGNQGYEPHKIGVALLKHTDCEAQRQYDVHKEGNRDDRRDQLPEPARLHPAGQHNHDKQSRNRAEYALNCNAGELKDAPGYVDNRADDSLYGQQNAQN